MNTLEHNPEKYHLLATKSGLRKVEFGGDQKNAFLSPISNDFDTINCLGKKYIDSDWNKNIFYIVDGNSSIHKIKNGIETSESLTDIQMICVAQNQEGNEYVWVIDGNDLKLLDENLGIIKTITNLSQVKSMSSDISGNCYILDNNLEKIIKVGIDGDIKAVIEYIDLFPAISSDNFMIELKVDGEGNMYLLTSKYIYKCSLSAANTFSILGTINLFSHIPSNMKISGLDLDFFDADFTTEESSIEEENASLYCYAGNASDTYLVKLDRNLVVIKTSLLEDYGFPYILIANKTKYSKYIYIVADSGKTNASDEYYDNSSSDSSSSNYENPNIASILQITKDLLQIQEVEVSKNNSQDTLSLSINHSIGVNANYGSLLNFSFSSLKNNPPLLKKETFCMVTETTVSVSDRNLGSDLSQKYDRGAYNQGTRHPAIPSGTSSLFTELKK